MRGCKNGRDRIAPSGVGQSSDGYLGKEPPGADQEGGARLIGSGIQAKIAELRGDHAFLIAESAPEGNGQLA